MAERTRGRASENGRAGSWEDAFEASQQDRLRRAGLLEKLLGLEQELREAFRSPHLEREEPAKHWTDLMEREASSEREGALFVAAFMFDHADLLVAVAFIKGKVLEHFRVLVQETEVVREQGIAELSLGFQIVVCTTDAFAKYKGKHSRRRWNMDMVLMVDNCFNAKKNCDAMVLFRLPCCQVSCEGGSGTAAYGDQRPSRAKTVAASKPFWNF